MDTEKGAVETETNGTKVGSRNREWVQSDSAKWVRTGGGTVDEVGDARRELSE